jgi:cardiolipin synthase
MPKWMPGWKFSRIRAATLLSGIYLAVRWIIRFVMLVIVPQRRTPAAAQAWLLLIFGEPLGGLLLYALIGRPELTPRRRRIQREVDDIIARTLADDQSFPHLRSLLATDLPARHQQIAQLVQRVGDLPVFTGNQATLLPDYDYAIDRLVADIDRATEHVHLLYYIFADDSAGRKVLAALQRAHERGVQCRLLIDAYGSLRWSRRIARFCADTGIAFSFALPLALAGEGRQRLDLRNHRKIVVIDNAIAYTGSQNIVDKHFKRGVVYKELVVRVAGPAVLQLQAVFAADWYTETGERVADPAQLEQTGIPAPTGGAAMQVLPSGPAYETANNLLVFNELLYAAQRRAVVITHYFVPDDSLLLALKSAALRGVETHLVVSTVADQFMVTRAQQSYYAELLRAGVRIHRFHEPTLLHAKSICIDDDIAAIGSSNMDRRSFELDLEVMLVIYDRHVVTALRAVEEDYFRFATELTAEDWQRRPLHIQFVDNTLRLLSALL